MTLPPAQPLSPLPASFQPSRTRSHRLSLARNSFSSSSFSSPSSFGASLLKPPPAAHLAGEKGKNRRGLNSAQRGGKRQKSGALGGPQREQWIRHGYDATASNVTAPLTASLAPESIISSLGAPIDLDAALEKRALSAAASGPLAVSIPSLAPPSLSIPSAALPNITPEPTPTNILDFSQPLLSFGSSRRHSRLGMLKHRTKVLSASAPAHISQHPRSPSLDITSAFPTLAAAKRDGGMGLEHPEDAFKLFDEAFPSPSLEPTPSPSLAALLSPKLIPAPTAMPTPTASSSSSPKTKGLRELELVKRRMSWESVSSAATIVGPREDEDPELTEEEKFEDAIEETLGDEQLLPSTSSTPPHILRSTFPTTLQLDPSSGESVVGLGLGLGLGFDLVEPEQPDGLLGLGLGPGVGLGLDMSGGETAVEVEAPSDRMEKRTIGDELKQEQDGLETSQDQLHEAFGSPSAQDGQSRSGKQATLLEAFNPDLGRRTVGEEVQQEQDGFKTSQHQLQEEFADPPTPLLEPAAPVVNSIPESIPASPKVISPRRQPRSPPRAKKVSRPLLKPARLPNATHPFILPTVSKAMKNKLPAAVKRIYPRPPEAELGRKVKDLKLRTSQQAIINSTRSQEDLFYGSPNLSDLPGSFVASPVLPTSFSDFSHSPLPTPPTRFSRVRRTGPQSAALPNFGASSALSPNLPSSSAPGWSSSSVPCTASTTSSPLMYTSMPSSPMGTPTLAASPAFSPSLGPSPFSDAGDMVMSAPSTPVPDQVVAAAASGSTSTGAAATAAAAGGSHPGEMNQQLFDAAIASSILGAIVCIGAVGWLAIAMVRKKLPGKQRKPISSRGIGSDDAKRFSDDYDDDDHNEKMPAPMIGGVAGRTISAPVLTDLPKPPPLARLSFPPGHTIGAPESPVDRSFSAHFDAWVDISQRRAQSTEDHGGYPADVMRGDGMSTFERRMSRASRLSTQSLGSRYPRSSVANRSSYRSSTGPSLVDSTWSRPGTGYSSRTSHHGYESCAISPTPPRLPSPILRTSADATDVATFFTTPPDTPTKPNRGQYSVPNGEVEPPVPSLPTELRDLTSSAPAALKTGRARSGSKSAGGKSSTKTPLKSAMKTMPALSSVDAEESPTEAALRKLEKRRATVDGGILADGLQALLFQAQLDSPTKGNGTASAENDIFTSSAGGTGSASIKRNSLTSGSGKSTHRSPNGKKARPVTMPHLPPTIVVSDHPNAAAPPTPVRNRATTAESEVTDTRASVKTYDGLPWLANSPSATFSYHPRDDAGSVIDPDMRSQKHFSYDTARFSSDSIPPPPPKRFSVDAMPPPPKRFSTQDFSSTRPSPHAPLDSIDIASRRLASEDDLASQTSAHDHGNDTDEEEARRTQRRKTLLYSVYKQRGVDLSPTSAPDSASSESATLSRTSLSEDSSTDTPTKGALREALVSSFPAPPLPDGSAFSSLVANLESIGTPRSSPSAVDNASQRTPDRSSAETDIGTAYYGPEDDELHITATPKEQHLSGLPTPPSTAAAPPRPPKSPIRMSVHADSVSPSPSSTRIPLPTRAATTTPRQPFAPVSINSLRSAVPSSSPLKPTAPAPPLRSFAAELQESVGNPAEGYDSDTLMSGLAFNKPGRALFGGLGGGSGGSGGSGGNGGFSSSSSAYGGFGASSMYSTNPGSIESLEEVVAIAQAETVQFGRSRASGIPQFSWKRQTAAIGQYDSEESAYEESDAETAMFRARMGMGMAPIVE
ncbi:hypothetical protein JCM5296_001502 [Sporobolomyces johnsonii]